MEYLREAIDTFTATGVAWNFGVQAREILPRTDAGFAVLHLGSDMKYETQAFRLPRTMQGGVSHLVPLSALSGSVRLASSCARSAERMSMVSWARNTSISTRRGCRSGIAPAGQRVDELRDGCRQRADPRQYSFVPVKNNLGDQHRIAVQIALR